MSEIIEKVAMKQLERRYPELVARLDELSAKEKDGSLSRLEKAELEALDSRLMKEYKPMVVFYRLNWPFMRRDVKQRLIEEAKLCP